MTDRLIIIDWGTTAFRAWLVAAADGNVIAEIPDGLGMRALERSQFAAYCRERLRDWLDTASPPPVYMAGMVGAVQGWQQAPQPPLPITRADLAANIVAVDDMPGAFILPGVRRAGPPAEADVIRGEEVQIFGALAELGREDAILCLPGTHSKWARVEADTFTHFSTSMTGEVYEVMLAHSILRLTATPDASFSPSAFETGLDQVQKPEGLLHHLFSARARGLYGDIAPDETASYVSGLLIGAEVAAMKDLYAPQDGEVLLVSAGRLRVPYETALAHAGLKSLWVPAREATLAGVRAIALSHIALSTETPQ